jgi:uncharacterized phage infection (PIP) family protein YhgE
MVSDPPTDSNTIDPTALSRLYAVSPLIALVTAKLAWVLSGVVMVAQPCDIPGAGPPMQLGITIVLLLVVIFGFIRFAGAIIAGILNNATIVAGVSILGLALWFYGAFDALLPFAYSALTGEEWASSGLQCAIGGENGSA